MFGMRLALVLGALLLPVTGASADSVKVGALEIVAPWARATPKGASTGGGYLKITNTGSTPDRLIGGVTGIASRVEMHEMSASGQVMKMRQITSGLEIKAGQTVEMKPGGLHLMFVGLKQQLRQGQHVKATLQFEKAGTVEVDFTVAGIGATTPDGTAAGLHGHMQMK